MLLPLREEAGVVVDGLEHEGVSRDPDCDSFLSDELAGGEKTWWACLLCADDDWLLGLDQGVVVDAVAQFTWQAQEWWQRHRFLVDLLSFISKLSAIEIGAQGIPTLSSMLQLAKAKAVGDRAVLSVVAILLSE